MPLSPKGPLTKEQTSEVNVHFGRLLRIGGAFLQKASPAR